MGFLKLLQKKDAGAKPHGDKQLEEVDVEGLDKTKELFRSLIYDGISLIENENLNSTLIFGVAGSGKTNGRLEVYKDNTIFETDSLLGETKNELES